MKYRAAKNLQKGDIIVRKSDSQRLEIHSVEVFGQYKTVKFTCLLPSKNGYISVYNEEIE